MKRLVSVAIALAASLLCASCIPLPHCHYYAPHAEGVVLEHGRPIANAKVQLTAKYTKKKSETHTDSSGHFVLQPLKEWSLITSLLGDPLYGYDLIITTQGQEHMAYSEHRIGFTPVDVTFTCDLSHNLGSFEWPYYCKQQER